MLHNLTEANIFYFFHWTFCASYGIVRNPSPGCLRATWPLDHFKLVVCDLWVKKKKRKLVFVQFTWQQCSCSFLCNQCQPCKMFIKTSGPPLLWLRLLVEKEWLCGAFALCVMNADKVWKQCLLKKPEVWPSQVSRSNIDQEGIRDSM